MPGRENGRREWGCCWGVTSLGVPGAPSWIPWTVFWAPLWGLGALDFPPPVLGTLLEPCPLPGSWPDFYVDPQQQTEGNAPWKSALVGNSCKCAFSATTCLYLFYFLSGGETHVT